jgi:hypothetical protein
VNAFFRKKLPTATSERGQGNINARLPRMARSPKKMVEESWTGTLVVCRKLSKGIVEHVALA